MDLIQHHHIEVNGLKLHIAEIGTGSRVVILLHGFPEIWYTWRHQMVALANAGFRAIAPDFRGYGLSDKPEYPEGTTFSDLVQDVLGIIDHLDIPKAFLIAKDFGVRPACVFALLHPDRVLGLITLGVPYNPLGPLVIRGGLPEGCYISRWQERGNAEADFGRFDSKTVVRKIYILFSGSELPVAGENQEILDLVGESTPLPPWLSEKDLAIYGSLYEKSGFQTALQVPYRSIKKKHDIPNPVMKLPALMIMGTQDYSLKFPGVREYIESEKVKEFIPNLKIIFLPKGTHFGHEQLPDAVNKFILEFLCHQLMTP